MDSTAWYWCHRHERAEPEGEACRALDRLGPYPSREAAEAWRDTTASRNEAWDAQDRRWHGDE